MNGYVMYVTFDKPNLPADPAPLSGGLVIATAPDEFVFAGTGMTITFDVDGTTEQTVGLSRVEEGKFLDGRWMPGRRLNGDQTHQGRHVRINSRKFEIQKVKLYRYN